VNLSRDDVALSTAATEAVMYPQPVPVNMYEATGALVVLAPLPAVTTDDVTVELHPGDPATLRFWAHVRSAGPREFLLHEWEYGGYERQVDVPPGFGAGVDASLTNGQLVVRVLAGEFTVPRVIHPFGPATAK
jgi:HSP20 family molecular chaperone IbpA